MKIDGCCYVFIKMKGGQQTNINCVSVLKLNPQRYIENGDPGVLLGSGMEAHGAPSSGGSLEWQEL